jgi:hypothetical protein
MKSTGRHVGNVNMRGKKFLRLGCGCCECQDFRERELSRAAKKELSEFDIVERDMNEK